jgi:hypothetical protein
MIFRKLRMKKILFIVSLTIVFCNQCLSQFIKIEGGKFINPDGTEFFQMAMNYHIFAGKSNVWTADSSDLGAFVYFGPESNDWCNLERCGDANTSATQQSQSSPNPYFCPNLMSDLTAIQNMGFNTIRLVQLAEISFNCSTEKPYAGYDSGSWPLDNVQNMNNHIQAVKNVLDYITVNFPHLKVVLLTGGHNTMKSANTLNSYNDYLIRLATEFSNYSCILAYDVFNEPSYFDITCTPNPFHGPKNGICNVVAGWYNNIKYWDNNHLVTIGLVPHDLGAWDMSIMSVDFVSFHIYPYRNSATPPNTNTPPSFLETAQTAMDRAYREIKWCSDVCPMPWIIGETGFSAMAETLPLPACDGVQAYDDDWGTEADQANYAQTSLNIVKNCGGIGYSWWLFQDLFYSTNKYVQNYEDYHGLISRNPERIEKVAGNVFRTFSQSPPSPGPCTYPGISDYFFPYNLAGNNNTSGTVVDPSGTPIPYAKVATSNSSQGWIWTTANNNGYFFLRSDNSISSIRVSAVGSTVYDGAPNSQITLGYQTSYKKDLMLSNQNFTGYSVFFS